MVVAGCGQWAAGLHVTVISGERVQLGPNGASGLSLGRASWRLNSSPVHDPGE
jgi:hypothetical protein